MRSDAPRHTCGTHVWRGAVAQRGRCMWGEASRRWLRPGEETAGRRAEERRGRRPLRPSRGLARLSFEQLMRGCLPGGAVGVAAVRSASAPGFARVQFPLELGPLLLGRQVLALLHGDRRAEPVHLEYVDGRRRERGCAARRCAAVADAHLVVGGAGGGPAFLEHSRELRGRQLVLPLLDRERLLQRGQLGVAPLEEEAQIVDVIVPRRRGGRRRRRGGGGGGLAGGLLHHRRAGLADHGCGAAAGRREEGAGKRCAKRSTSEFAARESPTVVAIWWHQRMASREESVVGPAAAQLAAPVASRASCHRAQSITTWVSSVAASPRRCSVGEPI